MSMIHRGGPSRFLNVGGSAGAPIDRDLATSPSRKPVLGIHFELPSLLAAQGASFSRKILAL